MARSSSTEALPRRFFRRSCRSRRASVTARVKVTPVAFAIASARRWALVWAVLLVAQGLLPVATVYLTGLLVDELVAAMWAHREHLLAHPAQKARRRRLQVRAQLADRVSELLRRAHDTAAEEAGFARWLDDVVERRCDPMTAARRLVRGS